MTVAPRDLIPALIFAVVLALVPLLPAVASRAGRGRNRRLARITDRFGVRAAATDRDGPSLLSGSIRPGLLGGVERTLAQFLPRPAALRQKLVRAGLNPSPGRFATVAAGLGVIAGSAVLATGYAPLLALAFAVVATLGLPNLWLSLRIGKRQKRFVALFPEAVDLMVRGLKSGVPVTQTIVSVGTEVQDPVGIEFRRVSDSAALGVPLIDSLWDAAKRIDTPEFRFFVVALTIQRETGGNLAETLENLSDILRRRLQMQLKVKAMSSEARSSAMIIGVLPFAMFGILMALNPNYAMILITDPRGMMMLGAGLLLMFFGMVVMARMVKFEI
jgi:tight adherence protein B